MKQPKFKKGQYVKYGEYVMKVTQVDLLDGLSRRFIYVCVVVGTKDHYTLQEELLTSTEKPNVVHTGRKVV